MSAVELARALRESLLDTIMVVVPLLAGVFLPTPFCVPEGDYFGIPSQTLQRSIASGISKAWHFRHSIGSHAPTDSAGYASVRWSARQSIVGRPWP